MVDHALPLGFEVLPDEILVKIVGFLPFKDLCRIGQVNRRMLTISKDQDCWKRVKISAATLPGHLMQEMMQRGISYLSIPSCTIDPVNPEFLEGHQSNLVHLNIACCDGNDELLSDIVATSKVLKSLNLEMTRGTLVKMYDFHIFSCLQHKETR